MLGLPPRSDRGLSYPVPRTPPDIFSGGAAQPARILVVEDDYFVALELEDRLSSAGFDVVGVAGTAEEALAMAASAKPELAIVDIRLAGLRDGIDAAVELATRLGVPSIFATAHGDAHTRRRAEQANPLGWLQKPYSSHELMAVVNAALAKKK
jgi:two-component system, response regulator PdtaR